MSNTDDEMNKAIMIDNSTVSLADLAGINLDDVAEKRGESFPKGNFVWEVESGEDAPKLGVVGEGDKAKGVAAYKLKCIDVITVDDREFTGDQTSLIGKYHRETFFLTTVEALGYLKAFAKDIGTPYQSKLQDLLAAGAGVRFQAPISKRTDKNDSDKVYTSIVRNKIKPVAAVATSDVAGKVA